MVEVLSRATQRFIIVIGVLQVVKYQRGQNLLIIGHFFNYCNDGFIVFAKIYPKKNRFTLE